MTITLGRASLAGGFSAASHNGDQVSLSFNILPATLAEAKVLRQQVLGLANNADEPVVPITDSDDSDIDGFYRITGASVEPVRSYQTNRLMRCQVSAERVGGGYAIPEIEMMAVVSKRPTTYSSPAAVDLVYTLMGHPKDAIWEIFDQAGSTFATLLTETGDVRAGWPTTGSAVNATKSMSYFVAAEDYYNGAVLIEQNIGGVWYPVVGRQYPISSADVATGDVADALRISNGAVRFGWNSTTDAFDLESWTSTYGWETVGSFVVHRTIEVAVTSVTIMRNSIDTGALTFHIGTGRMTVSIRRGVTMFDVSIFRLDESVSLRHDGVSAGTATVGGIYQAAAVASSGHQWVLATSDDYTIDTTNGRLTWATTTLDTQIAGIGVILIPAGWSDAEIIVGKWWMASALISTVVAR